MSRLSRLRTRIEETAVPVPESGCWLWPLAPDEKGYGLITVDGKTRKAHRESYRVFHGEIPEGRVVMHTCDCRACVNPEHLRLGSQLDNVKDRDRKGRMFRKLSDQAVAEIRASLEPAKILAEKYGVSAWAIYDVRNPNRRRFSNV